VGYICPIVRDRLLPIICIIVHYSDTENVFQVQYFDPVKK
jgi:hypothetical protein